MGVGTMFTVLLPALDANVSAPRVRQSSRPPPAASRSYNILVVDDDVFVARSIRRLLRPKHEVTLAMSGREALRLLENHSYDMVFCDVMMPEMTGLELHQAVAARNAELARRFVFITGGPFTPEASSLFSAVTNPCVQKPFTPADLHAAMESVASGGPETPELSQATG
jgi:CheY-like chemotaxis protein